MMKCLSPIVFVMLLSACAGTTGGSSGADTSGTSGGTTEGSAGSSKPSSTVPDTSTPASKTNLGSGK